VWALASFAVGDLLLARRAEFSRLALSFSADGLRAAAALVLSYVLLAGLLVLIPVVSNAVRLACAAALARRAPMAPTLQARVSGAALVLTEGALAFLWTQSTPFLIRPVWSFFARSPDVPAIEPLQQRGWIVAFAVMLAAVGRLVLEGRASAHLDPLAMPGLGTLRPPLPWKAVVAGRTAFVTFPLSGLLGSWWGALLTAAALGGVFTLYVRAGCWARRADRAA
jgi:hypothetical protein